MPGKPRRFEPEEPVKVTLRVPKDMYENIWKYAQRYGYSFNEAAARLLAFGIGGQELGDREVVWTNRFFAEFQKSEIFGKLRDDFRASITDFLREYYEKDPATLLTEIVVYAGGHFDYFQKLLDLEKENLAKAIAGNNPEVQKKFMEFFEMLAWVWNWVYGVSKPEEQKELDTEI
jgi:hypothetical protein